MTSESTLREWARRIILAQSRELEIARRKRLEPSENPERLHKIRTRARRLRCALEDLNHCTADAAAFLAQVKRLGDQTSKARDGQVLLQRLKKYRESASHAERSEIDRILKVYKRECKRWNRAAADAIREFQMPSGLL